MKKICMLLLMVVLSITVNAQRVETGWFLDVQDTNGDYTGFMIYEDSIGEYIYVDSTPIYYFGEETNYTYIYRDIKYKVRMDSIEAVYFILIWEDDDIIIKQLNTYEVKCMLNTL